MGTKALLPEEEKKRDNIEGYIAENATKSNAIEIPEISLPKGGGALKGIDEKFEVNSANGTSSFAIPLPLTAGRGGFTPSLALSYNSGGGNSPFGLGWTVAIPSIQRKTENKLPKYEDNSLDEDIFMISGSEDLVPQLKEVDPGEWQADEFTVDPYTIKKYRPRIEGSFSRIEKITHPAQGTYWKVTSKENIKTFYGYTAQARINDPSDDTRIFKWLPEFSYDDKGNWIRYIYKKENQDNIPNELHEQNRISGNALYTNSYLKNIQYGNLKPYYGDAADPYRCKAPDDEKHFFEAVFDYGEHDAQIPAAEEIRPWDFRQDAFSSYRSGFEIRTCRLCRRVLIFHKFEELGAAPCLVRALTFSYKPSSINNSGQAEVSYLSSVTQTGFIRKADGTYAKKSLPHLEFEYQELQWNHEIKKVDAENIINAPVGLTNNYQWLDLYGEGISGIFTEQGQGWYYKSNLGASEDGEARFTEARKVSSKPSFSGLAEGTVSLQDLEANGERQIVIHAPNIKGYFNLDGDEFWDSFQAFRQAANINLKDPNVRLIDLNGDGRPELVVTEENVFTWYPSEGKQGYSAAELAHKTFDEERGPAVVFADLQQSIFLADMSGDGLTDIVRIKNGEICYWANKGYGRFGAKVNMSNAPVFDHPDSFNPKHLHLADISGTGTTDILYLADKKFGAYINLGGNSWSDPHCIDPFFPIDKNSAVSVVDLLGTGTPCIVWSSDLPRYSPSPLRYIDLMGSKKPHLFRCFKNNLGKETSLEYKSSTYYYLKDKAEGRPWITKLPFPVHVVSKKIIEEKITKVRFTSEYTYHHGYYDFHEREFRGFGRVEQVDSEHYETWKANNLGNMLELSQDLYQKPVLIKTWYHTGASIESGKILTQYRSEYWHEEYKRRFSENPLPAAEPELQDAQLIAAANILDPQSVTRLNGDEWREALRSCKGMMLREEVFALDAPETDPAADELKLQSKPFSVKSHRCSIQVIQPRKSNKHGAFLVTTSETLAIRYERNVHDPRISHTLNTKIDEIGNILEAASVVYPRHTTDPALPPQIQDEQAKTLIRYSRTAFTNDVIQADAFLLRQISQLEDYEITRLPRASPLYQIKDFDDVLQSATQEICYHETASGPAPERRLIEKIRTLYYKDDLSGPLDLHEQEPGGITYQNYQMAYTPDLLSSIFGAKIPDQNTLLTEGFFGHCAGDTQWWIKSGRINYIDTGLGENADDAKNRFYSPLSFEDQTGAITKVLYYKDYFLLTEKTEDCLSNSMTIEKFDFRTLDPVRMRDMNGNLNEVVLDELGLVKAVAVLGKDLDDDGIPELETADDLANMEAVTENEAADIQTFLQTGDLAVLDQKGRDLLKHASIRFVYDFEAYTNSGQPAVAAAINRETHHAHLQPGEQTKIQVSFEYSDGMGSSVMSKLQAEPGLAKKLLIQPDNSYVVQEIDTAALVPAQLRWLGSGRTVRNNKGKPVRQYEPFFSVTPRYEDAKELVESGVSPVYTYDSLGRLVKTEFPDRTFSEVKFDSWKRINYDQNDTVGDSPWYGDRVNNLIDAELAAAGKDPAKEKEAAQKAVKHHDTPTTVHLDTLGRPILHIEHNRDEDGIDDFYHTVIERDIEGNTKKIRDARSNDVVTFRFNMLGHRIYQNSMDSGERWLFNNAAGKASRRWDSRNHIFHFKYDVLQRPLESKVVGGDGAAPFNHVYDKFVYGEGQADDRLNNLRGKTFERYDTAGKIRYARYDFKSNSLLSTRRFAINYKDTINWDTPDPEALLEAETFTTEFFYDALNRITKALTPDSSITETGFNEANLLETVDVTQNGGKERFIKNINYDAKGQRTLITYGNDISSTYHYDDETFRLLHIFTAKKNGEILQDLHYTYDPAGNVLETSDESLPTIFFGNHMMEAKSLFTYDAVYRLIKAQGREHIAQAGFGAEDNWNDNSFLKKYSSGDPMAWRNYTQKYKYDAEGNLQQIQHITAGGGWTRDYTCEAANNRLQKTTVGSRNYDYPHHPEHGFITSMPHLQRMDWDCHDQLSAVSKQRVTEEITPETTYYVYDSNGQRVRKVTECQAVGDDLPARKNERYYLGSVEIYREHSGVNSGLERTSLHVMDETRRIAVVDTRNAVNDGTDKKTVRYQFGNLIGSTSLETNASTQVISYEEYHPYGTTAYQAVDTAVKAAAKRFRYNAMERDEESGFNYHAQRYYAPWIGRWLSPDPEGLVDGNNVYVFSRSNPIVFSDPSGTCPYCVVNTGDPDDPNNYVDFESFRAGVSGPLTEQAIREAWVAAHPEDTHLLVSEDPSLAAAPPESGPVSEELPVCSPEQELIREETEIRQAEEAAEAEEPEIVFYEEYEETYTDYEETQIEVQYAGGGSVAAGTLAISGGLLADDLTGIGIADDPAIPFVFVGGMLLAGILYLTTTTTRTETLRIPITRTRTRRRRAPLVYVTYTKTNPATGQVYTGRSRGHGTPQQVVAARDSAHHMTARGFGPAVLDQSTTAALPVTARHADPAYQAIRGREQQMIDLHGGSLSDGGTSGNAIRGVSKINPLGRIFHAASTLMFGEVHPYTGY